MTSKCEHADHRTPCKGSVASVVVNPRTYRERMLCERHFEEAWAAWEHAAELMSPLRPSWFDEGYAGERWDEDN